MKLYLSSEMLPHPDKLRELVGIANPTIVVIWNAFDPYFEDRKAEFYRAVTASLVPLGGHQRVVDLREFQDRTAELTSMVADAHLIWVTGGNTFWLRYLMQVSGFDQIIRPIVEAGTVYGGFSAGAIVAGPTLEAVDLIDDPMAAPTVIGEGLNLTDTVVWPHWGKTKYQSIQLQIDQALNQLVHPVVRLHDGQAYCVSGNSGQILA